MSERKKFASTFHNIAKSTADSEFFDSNLELWFHCKSLLSKNFSPLHLKTFSKTCFLKSPWPISTHMSTSTILPQYPIILMTINIPVNGQKARGPNVILEER